MSLISAKDFSSQFLHLVFSKLGGVSVESELDVVCLQAKHPQHCDKFSGLLLGRRFWIEQDEQAFPPLRHQGDLRPGIRQRGSERSHGIIAQPPGVKYSFHYDRRIALGVIHVVKQGPMILNLVLWLACHITKLMFSSHVPSLVADDFAIDCYRGDYPIAIISCRSGELQIVFLRHGPWIESPTKQIVIVDLSHFYEAGRPFQFLPPGYSCLAKLNRRPVHLVIYETSAGNMVFAALQSLDNFGRVMPPAAPAPVFAVRQAKSTMLGSIVAHWASDAYPPGGSVLPLGDVGDGEISEVVQGIEHLLLRKRLRLRNRLGYFYWSDSPVDQVLDDLVRLRAGGYVFNGRWLEHREDRRHPLLFVSLGVGVLVSLPVGQGDPSCSELESPRH